MFVFLLKVCIAVVFFCSVTLFFINCKPSCEPSETLMKEVVYWLWRRYEWGLWWRCPCLPVLLVCLKWLYMFAASFIFCVLSKSATFSTLNFSIWNCLMHEIQVMMKNQAEASCVLTPCCPCCPGPGTNFFSITRPQQQQQQQVVGGSLPYRRPSSGPTHSQSQLNGGPPFTQSQGMTHSAPCCPQASLKKVKTMPESSKSKILWMFNIQCQALWAGLKRKRN